MRIILIGGGSLQIQEILDRFSERKFPVAKIQLVAEGDRCGTILEFKGEPLLVGRLNDISTTDYHAAVLLSEITELKKITTQLVKENIPLLDLSGSFTPSEKIPIIFSDYWNVESKNLPKVSLAPSPLSIIAGLICRPIHDIYEINNLMICGVQGASNLGSKKGMDELFEQTKALLSFNKIVKQEFSKQIAFNVFSVDDIQTIENRIQNELRAFLGSKDLIVSADFNWGSFFVGLIGTMRIETQSPISVAEIKAIVNSAPSVSHWQGKAPFALLDVVGEDIIIVDSFRVASNGSNILTLRFAMDNLRKGWSTNLSQILEMFSKEEE